MYNSILNLGTMWW